MSKEKKLSSPSLMKVKESFKMNLRDSTLECAPRNSIPFFLDFLAFDVRIPLYCVWPFLGPGEIKRVERLWSGLFSGGMTFYCDECGQPDIMVVLADAHGGGWYGVNGVNYVPMTMGAVQKRALFVLIIKIRLTPLPSFTWCRFLFGSPSLPTYYFSL